MSEKAVFALRLLVAVALIALAAVFSFQRLKKFGQTGEEGARVWFYDTAEARLFAVPRDTVPPDKGSGGKPGAGVRAVAVGYRSSEHDPAKLKVAYLEEYSPELKRTLDAVMAAHAARKPYDGKPPSPASRYFQDNTLVRRVADTEWQPASSEEGRKIMAGWRAWTGPNGERPLICMPE